MRRHFGMMLASLISNRVAEPAPGNIAASPGIPDSGPATRLRRHTSCSVGPVWSSSGSPSWRRRVARPNPSITTPTAPGYGGYGFGGFGGSSGTAPGDIIRGYGAFAEAEGVYEEDDAVAARSTPTP